jgi:hypothetical protein
MTTNCRDRMETAQASWAPSGARVLTVEPDITDIIYQIHSSYGIRADNPEPCVIFNGKSAEIIRRHEYMVTTMSAGHPYLLYLTSDGVRFSSFLINRYRPRDGSVRILSVPLDISELWPTGDWLVDAQMVQRAARDSTAVHYDLLLRNILVSNGRLVKDSWHNRLEMLYKTADKVKSLLPTLHIKACRFHKVSEVANIKEPWLINGYEFVPMDSRHLPIRYFTNQKTLQAAREWRMPRTVPAPSSRAAAYSAALKRALESSDDTGNHPALTDYPDSVPISESKTIRTGSDGTFQIIEKNVVQGCLRVHKLETVLTYRAMLAASPTKSITVRAYLDPSTQKWTTRDKIDSRT